MLACAIEIMVYGCKVICPWIKYPESLSKVARYHVAQKAPAFAGRKPMKAVRSELMFPCNGNFPAKGGKTRLHAARWLLEEMNLRKILDEN
jgi:hypothetical protein